MELRCLEEVQRESDERERDRLRVAKEAAKYAE